MCVGLWRFDGLVADVLVFVPFWGGLGLGALVYVVSRIYCYRLSCYFWVLLLLSWFFIVLSFGCGSVCSIFYSIAFSLLVFDICFYIFLCRGAAGRGVVLSSRFEICLPSISLWPIVWVFMSL